MKPVLSRLISAFIFLAALQGEASPRVALMDLSTDDNSYRSAQAAASFTGLLQVRLAGEPGVEWVERAQLDKARQELELSAMALVGGGSSIRQGKWLKADWMITGQFSLDDRNRRTLFLEITDLQHADVLASRTITFPDTATSPFQIGTNQLGLAARDVRSLLAEARRRQQQLSDKILVAPLFLANITGPGLFKGRESLEQDFGDALERAVAASRQIQLIHFPKAYRSTGESELVLDGLVEADRNAWQKTADLYVWGTCTATNRLMPNRSRESRWEIDLHLWDGVSPPVVISEDLPCSSSGEVQPDQLAAALNRLADQVQKRAHKSTAQTDTASMRREIARSLVETYDRMTLRFHHREELGFTDPGKFLQAAHMLETACFFDPDNVNTRVLYLSCRWGFWIRFGDNVKNPFWSQWRCSQAWGKYVDRFGLKPVEVDLPFPYQQRGGIPAAYVGSQEEALKMFPQWHSVEDAASEDEWQRRGVHTGLVEAELHGFPKDMPHDLALQWRVETEKELARRRKQVAEYAPANVSEANHTQTVSDRLSGSMPNRVPPGSPGHSLSPSAKNTAPRLPVQTPGQMGATPSWANDINTRAFSSMFRLSPPNALPVEVKPSVKEFQFPEQFGVQSVDQLDFLGDKLLILAMDKRAATPGDNSPDVSAERLNKFSRLWTVGPGETNAVLYEPDLFPNSIEAFLLKDSQLWVAGKITGCLDLKTRQFRRFSLTDGFDLQNSSTLGFAGEHLFVAGDDFRVSVYDAAQDRWSRLVLPPARLSRGTSNPFMLGGNKQQLVCVAGSVLIHDPARNTWTNLAGLSDVLHILADDSGFWFGGRFGLHFYDPTRQSAEHWTAPATFEGIFNQAMYYLSMGNATMPAGNADKLDAQIQGSLTKFRDDHAKNRAAQGKNPSAADPLHLDWRVPGEATALANDGDFLWVGFGNYFGSYLLLLHKPSRSWVGGYPMMVRDRISSLAVSATSVWIGTAYGDHKLIQIPKTNFLSVAQNQWVSLAVSPEERTRLVKSMSVRDQALYAFYAGDDARVAALLGNLDPAKATLEEMFLLAFCYEASGLDRPELARTWFGQIISRHPDSPWAKFADAVLAQNEQNHKIKRHEAALLTKYDRNHNGVLDPEEQREMKKNPEYLAEQKAWNAAQMDDELNQVLRRFDVNKDGKLDREELAPLKGQVTVFSRASPEMLAAHKNPFRPLLTRNFPEPTLILQKFDANGDGGLEINELKALAQDIQREK
jgi:hypothetical protein